MGRVVGLSYGKLSSFVTVVRQFVSIRVVSVVAVVVSAWSCVLLWVDWKIVNVCVCALDLEGHSVQEAGCDSTAGAHRI